MKNTIWRNVRCRLTDTGEHFRDFPVAADSRSGARKPGLLGMQADRGRAVFSERLAAGFGGLIIVMMILFAAQMATGVRAFPL